MDIVAFLPCRKGSERVQKKNTRRFANSQFGLIEIKLNQLISIKEISRIVLSTNDEDIISFAEKLKTEKIDIYKRDEALSSGKTQTDELVNYAHELIPSGHIMWTHVTSPFLNKGCYRSILDKYRVALSRGFDSLMTVNEFRGFLWNKVGPVNYDREFEKWPRTQTIKPLYEINSGAFITSSELYKQFNDRIGKTPFLYVLNKIQGFDIDWEEDFQLAECMLKSGIAEI